MKRLSLCLLLLLPGCSRLYWSTDMTQYEIELYGRVIDAEPNFYPHLSRNDRIYLKYREKTPFKRNDYHHTYYQF